MYTVNDAKTLERAAKILERRKGHTAMAAVTRILRETADHIRADAARQFTPVMPQSSGAVKHGAHQNAEWIRPV